MSKMLVAGVFALAVSVTASSAQQLAAPYGSPIGADSAKKVVAAALAEARKNNWRMAAAVVDPAGELVYFERIDGTQYASNALAIDKAQSSVRYKRPTKAFQDAIAKGGVEMRFLSMRGVMPAEGGVPIVMNNMIVGAIGISGGTGAQDEQVAEAGVAASH
jgi:glc operon protein GlcG